MAKELSFKFVDDTTDEVFIVDALNKASAERIAYMHFDKPRCLGRASDWEYDCGGYDIY